MNKIIKAIIVDDQQLGIDSLKWELERSFSDIEIISTFTSPIKAINFINENNFDILFLDIQMPEMNGFELLDNLKNHNFSTIFITAFEQFALKAFKYSALEYLLKPVDKDELEKVLEKFKDKKTNEFFKEQILLQQSIMQGTKPNKVVFSTQESLEFVDPQNILYCVADGNYCEIILSQRTLVVSKSLKEIEILLSEFGFIRIHQSYLINPEHITKYLKTAGGSIVMDNGKELSISRAKRDHFFERFIASFKK